MATDETNAVEYAPTAAQSTTDDLDHLVRAMEYADDLDHKALGSLGVESDDNDPGELAEEAERALDEMPLGVDRTMTFEVVLGTGGPDSRLLFECDAIEGIHGFDYELRRVLFRYSWDGSREVELTGGERDVAIEAGRRWVPELCDA